MSGTAIFVASTQGTPPDRLALVASRAYTYRSPRTVNKTDKSFVRLTKEKGERNQVSKIRNERGNVTPKQLQRIIKDYYEQLHANKFDNKRNG